jgi:hypothetical protein
VPPPSIIGRERLDAIVNRTFWAIMNREYMRGKRLCGILLRECLAMVVNADGSTNLRSGIVSRGHKSLNLSSSNQARV